MNSKCLIYEKIYDERICLILDVNPNFHCVCLRQELFFRLAEETIPELNTDLIPIGTQVLDCVSCSYFVI